jgi:hypothetical protein
MNPRIGSRALSDRTAFRRGHGDQLITDIVVKFAGDLDPTASV